VNERASRLLELSRMLREASIGASKLRGGMFAEFYARYEDADADGRRLLARRLPPIMVKAHPAAARLETCHRPIFEAFRRHAAALLSSDDYRIGMAAWIFVARSRVLRKSERTAERLDELLNATVIHWNNRDIKDVRMTAHRMETNGSMLVDDWMSKNRGGRVASLFRWMSGR
jgi:hypothetical protein